MQINVSFWTIRRVLGAIGLFVLVSSLGAQIFIGRNFNAIFEDTMTATDKLIEGNFVRFSEMSDEKVNEFQFNLDDMIFGFEDLFFEMSDNLLSAKSAALDSVRDAALQGLRDSKSLFLEALVADSIGDGYVFDLRGAVNPLSNNPGILAALESGDSQRAALFEQIVGSLLPFTEGNYVFVNAVLYGPGWQPLSAESAGNGLLAMSGMPEYFADVSMTEMRTNIGYLWRNSAGLGVHSLFVPLGPGGSAGVLEVVSNPADSLAGVGTYMGGVIEVLTADGAVVFEDRAASFDMDITSTSANLDQTTLSIPDVLGNPALTIRFSQDITSFNRVLRQEISRAEVRFSEVTAQTNEAIFDASVASREDSEAVKASVQNELAEMSTEISQEIQGLNVQAQGDVRQAEIMGFIAMILALAVAAGAGFYILTRSTFKTMGEFAAAMDFIGNSDYDKVVVPETGRDEMGLIAATLKDVTARLKEQVAIE